MAIAFVDRVGQNNANAGGTSLVVTVGAPGAAQGHKLFVAFATNGDGTEVAPTCVDSKGNIYTIDDDRNMSLNGTKRLVVFSSLLTVALVNGDTITCACPTLTLRAMDVLRFSGLGAAKDRVTSRQVSTSTGASTLNTEPRRLANEVVIGICCWRNAVGTNTFTAGVSGAGYLAANLVVTATGFLYLATEYQIFSATGIESADGTISIANGWIMTGIGYCEPGVTFGQAPVVGHTEFTDVVGTT